MWELISFFGALITSYYSSSRGKYVLQGSYRKDEDRCVQFGENRGYIGNIVAASTQSRDKLGDWKSQDDKMPTTV